VADYVYLAERLTETGGVHGLEINISCPNVKHGCDFAVAPELTKELLTAVRRATDLTLITKLSPNVTDIVPIARAAVEGGSDALSLINTLLGTAIDARKRTFRLANITGGLSGPAIKPVALRLVWQVHRALPDIPLIGMGGIITATDVVEFLLAGATAVAIGTATFVTPTAVTDIVRGLESFLRDNQIDDVNDLIGTVHS
jgi:dihydroorotate dehydrogenase (NAD+) catalytic subunit